MSREIKYRSENLESLINNYIDLMVDDYQASDIFERLLSRMRENSEFTATELTVALCIAYDKDFIPIIVREIEKFSPLIFSKLEEMGKKFKTKSH